MQKIKMDKSSWQQGKGGNGSVTKSTCFSCRLEFGSQHHVRVTRAVCNSSSMGPDIF